MAFCGMTEICPCHPRSRDKSRRTTSFSPRSISSKVMEGAFFAAACSGR